MCKYCEQAKANLIDPDQEETGLDIKEQEEMIRMLMKATKPQRLTITAGMLLRDNFTIQELEEFTGNLAMMTMFRSIFGVEFK